MVWVCGHSRGLSQLQSPEHGPSVTLLPWPCGDLPAALHSESRARHGLPTLKASYLYQHLNSHKFSLEDWGTVLHGPKHPGLLLPLFTLLHVAHSLWRPWPLPCQWPGDCLLSACPRKDSLVFTQQFQTSCGLELLCFSVACLDLLQLGLSLFHIVLPWCCPSPRSPRGVPYVLQLFFHCS